MVGLSSIIDDLTALADDLGALGEQYTREFQTTHAPGDAGRVAVETRNGAIEVHPVDGTDLVVDATVNSRHEDDDLDAVDVDVTETGETIVLSVDIPDTHRSTSVDLDVGLPSALALARVTTKNGVIDVHDVRGDATIEAKNGKITVTDVDGAVAVHTKNGKVDVHDTHVSTVTSKNGKLDLVLPGLDADATVETKNGGIDISVPADVDADFALSTRLGTTTVEGLSMLVEEETPTSIAGELGAGGPLLDAHTKHGVVALRAR